MNSDGENDRNACKPLIHKEECGGLKLAMEGCPIGVARALWRTTCRVRFITQGVLP